MQRWVLRMSNSGKQEAMGLSLATHGTRPEGWVEGPIPTVELRPRSPPGSSTDPLAPRAVLRGPSVCLC